MGSPWFNDDQCEAMKAEAEAEIPACPECLSDRTKHFGNHWHEDDPAHAWFQCLSCDHAWTDRAVSARLLGVEPKGE